MRQFGLDTKKLPRALIITFITLCIASYAILTGVSGSSRILPPVFLAIIGTILLLVALLDVIRVIRRLKANPRMIISPEGVEDTSPAGQALGLIHWSEIEAVLIHEVQRKRGSFTFADPNALGLLPKNAQILRDSAAAQQYLAYGITVDPLAPSLDALLQAMQEMCPDTLVLRDGYPLRTYPLELDAGHIVRGLYREAALKEGDKRPSPAARTPWPELTREDFT